MTRRARGLSSDARGTTLIEFALLCPLFFMLVFGIVVFGLYFTTDIAITYAATEAARASEAGLSDSERESLADAAATQIITSYAPLLSVRAATIGSGPAPGNGGLFQVTISYDFQSFGLTALAAFVPVPSVNPSASVTVSHGGY